MTLGIEKQPVAVSYLRVSTKEQAERDGDPEGYSIPAQRAANRRKAESLFAVIPPDGEFVDRGESARSADRPALKEMLDYLSEHPEVSYVIVHKVDRLARNRLDDVQINMEIQKAGVQLVSATENIDESPSGMLLHGIMSTIAEFYSRNLANEVTKGMTQKAKSGGTPGHAPIGYRNVQYSNEAGSLVRSVELDPERAPLIKWAYEAFATGEWTLSQMTTRLEAVGFTSSPSRKRAGRPITRNRLHEILTNPYYKGVVTWREIEYEGRHEAIVEPHVWSRVQEVLATHRVGEKAREHAHYLKSSLFCGNCKSRMIVHCPTNRYGVTYSYFVCLGRHQKTSDCTRKAVSIDQIEGLVEELYRTVQLSPAMREELESLLLDELGRNRLVAEAEERSLTIQRRRLVNERTKLLQAHYADAIPLDQLKEEQHRIAEALEAIDARLSAVQAKFDVIEHNVRIALDLAGDCYRAYLNASDADRRRFNQAFFSRIYVEDDEVYADLAEPFLTMFGSPTFQPAAALTASRREKARPEHVLQAGFSLNHWAASFDEGVKEAGLVPLNYFG